VELGGVDCAPLTGLLVCDVHPRRVGPPPLLLGRLLPPRALDETFVGIGRYYRVTPQPGFSSSLLGPGILLPGANPAVMV
jgi:hypothetical protein